MNPGWIVIALVLIGVGCTIGRFVYLAAIAASLEKVDLPDEAKKRIMNGG